MKWGKVLGLGLLGRRVSRELTAIRTQMERQNTLLERLADKFAPIEPIHAAAEMSRTGVDHLDVDEAAIVEQYAQQCVRDLGRMPTEDEVLTYLADEKTVDLHQRLRTREQEMDRLASNRAGA